MRINTYKKVLTLSLLTTVLVTFIGQIEYYVRLQPQLDPHSDSISIPIFFWSVFLLTEGIVLWVIQKLLNWRMAALKIQWIRNLYQSIFTDRGAISVKSRLVAFIIPVSFLAWHSFLWITEMREVGILYLGVAYTVSALLYALVLTNYLMNSCYARDWDKNSG